MSSVHRSRRPSQPFKPDGRTIIPFAALLAFCLFAQPVRAVQTSTYQFLADKSTITQTGGIAGIHRTYTITGTLGLALDFETGTASFDRVDANAVDDSPFINTLDPNEVFNLTGLSGIIIDPNSIQFEGTAPDGSSVLITLTFADDTIALNGQTTPPPNSADFFTFTLGALAQRKYSGGTGDPNDPYQIATAEDILAMTSERNDWDKHFAMVDDVNMMGNLFAYAPIAPGIPRYGRLVTRRPLPFTGTFDGNGHRILGLKIAGGSRVGMFGNLGKNGLIENLGIEDVDVSGNNVDIFNDSVGGLVGYNDEGTVNNCYSTGRVGGSKVGGLVGENHQGMVSNCYSTCVVKGSDHVGGLMGVNYRGTVIHCYSSGAVSGDDYVGGLVGENDGVISRCYSNGTVSGDWYVGGFLGANGEKSDYNSATTETPGTVTLSYSNSIANGNRYVGGLVGENNWGAVTHCYSTGVVIGGEDVGGLVGHNSTTSGTVSNCFWDKETSRQDESDGGVGLTTARMQDIDTFVNAGWDFVAESANGLQQFWKMPDGGGYPVLSIFNGYEPAQLGGKGTADEPYLISDANDLAAICYYDTVADYRMIASIDLSGISWSIALVPEFGGNFDGNGFAIRNLTILGSNNVGLFGTLRSGSLVENLRLEDVYITGDGIVGALTGTNNGTIIQCYSICSVNGGKLAGGLVGSNCGTVSQCSSTGAVSGIRVVGGLVGYSNNEVKHCYSTGAVNGNESVGGLVGYNGVRVVVARVSSTPGLLTQCYSTGAVTGLSRVGGLVGENDGIVNECYTTGVVSGESDTGGLIGESWDLDSTTSSLWNVETSRQTGSAGGIGKTTGEMQTAKTFLDAGWDFVDETDNGTEDVWWILEGRDYPRLWWQLPGDDFEDGKAEPLWFVYEVDPGIVQITERNGRLETTASAEAQNVDAFYVSDGWRLDATEEFAMRVDFHFGRQGPGDGRVTLGVGPSLDPEARQWAEFEAGCFDTGPFYLYEVSDGFWVQEVVADRSSDDGTLYMSYDPDTDELYFGFTGYGKADAWQTVTGLLKGRWASAPVYVILGGGSERMALTGSDAWLDNFIVSSGQVYH